jgi:hypothetical protein
MDYSLHLYGEVRQHLRTVLQDCAAAGQRVAMCGRGEAAELAYLSLKESGLEPVAVFDKEGGHEFLGMPVSALADHAQYEFDLIIVATLDPTSTWCADLIGAGVPESKLFPLRKQLAPKKTKASPRARNGHR